MVNVKIQSTTNQLKKMYTDFLDSNPPKDVPYLYREVAAILGATITKICDIQCREEEK